MAGFGKTTRNTRMCAAYKCACMHTCMHVCMYTHASALDCIEGSWRPVQGRRTFPFFHCLVHGDLSITHSNDCVCT